MVEREKLLLASYLILPCGLPITPATMAA